MLLLRSHFLLIITNPNASVKESELISVIANYFNISDSYDEFAKYQISLNGYNDTALRSHSVKMGEFAQIVSELTNSHSGNIDDSLSYLNKGRVIDVGTVTDGTSVSDLAGSELLLNKAQLAVLMHKVSNSQLTISKESEELYKQNSNKKLDELTTSINKDTVVSVANATPKSSKDSEINTVSNKISEKTRQKVLEDAKVSEVMNALEKERPIVEGAKIKKYVYVEDNDYAKNNKYYKVYRVYWTKSTKVSLVGISIHAASSYEMAMYSKSGNHIDSKAKFTAKQKKIINTLKNSKTYSKKFRYVAVYDTFHKLTQLYLIPKSGKTTHYERNVKKNAYGFDSAESINLPLTTKSLSLKSTTKIGYDLNILPHIDSYSNWYRAFKNIGDKFHNYYPMTQTIALKDSH